jgi:hypothetical protein
MTENPNIPEFNKSCALVLGWECLGGQKHNPMYSCPERFALFGSINLSSMHFHDSYDWAMLLVRECDRRGKLESLVNILAADYGTVKNREFEISKFVSKIFMLTPQQIAQAALTVLEGETK